MIYIITSRYQLALEKCHELGINSHDRTKVRIITRAEATYGIDFDPEKDTEYFLALPEDLDRPSVGDLHRAWQFVLDSSRARRS